MCSSFKEASRLEVLVIDDDKIITLLHKNLLKDFISNQQPVLFRNAKKALEYLLLRNCTSNGFLILLDLHMPLYSGWQFLKELEVLDMTCSINVVLVTSSIQKKEELDSLKFKNVIGFCRKPLRTGQVQEIKRLKEITGYFENGNLIPKALICKDASAEKTSG